MYNENEMRDDMLKKQRQEAILKYLDENRYAKVDELAEVCRTSEITIRRDINELHELGQLRKVYGGAEAINLIKKDQSIKHREVENLSTKQEIAKKASDLVKDGQIVYLDAGTSIHCMIPFLKDKDIQVFTHGVHHVEALTRLQIPTHLIGGQIKMDTLCAAGASTIDYMSQFRFDIAFLGVNAIDDKLGFMTPDINEAMVKKQIIARSQVSYILADASKFNLTSNVTFANSDVAIITNKKPKNLYKSFTIRV